MSLFDAQSFLDAQIDGVLEKRDPLPTTREYRAVIGELIPRNWQSKDGSKEGVAFDVPLAVDVPVDLQEAGGLPPTLNLRDGIMLDLTPAGAIDTAKGKNSKLRMYRDALDMNQPGVPFNPRSMTGRVVLVRIKHEEYPEGTGNLQERPVAVARA
tara:strand:+ start:323 stop:787 length:465 start_codon:yes stop_codon:yes gene_type:complete